jgi:hypothetical protein
LTAMGFSLSMISSLSYLTRFTHPFLEEVMKWVYIKMPNLCLPEASA